jgi:hypothetical protein
MRPAQAPAAKKRTEWEMERRLRVVELRVQSFALNVAFKRGHSLDSSKTVKPTLEDFH